MPHPREVVPGCSYMLTRRCTQRQFLLRPDAATNEAFLYCLGVAAERTGVELLFTIANANHHHTGIRDPFGRYPEFHEHFHKLLARCQNAHRGRWENLWATEQASVVRLVEPGDALAKMVYALTNPVKDQLVARAHHWPGASSLAATRGGRTLVARRPRHFFREGGRMPETVTLRLVRSEGFEAMSHAAFVAELDRRIAEVEGAAAAVRRETGRRVMGRAGVLAQRWRDRRKSAEPRRGLSPTIAAASKWSRIEALQRRKVFHEAYRRARVAFMRRGPGSVPRGHVLGHQARRDLARAPNRELSRATARTPGAPMAPRAEPRLQGAAPDPLGTAGRPKRRAPPPVLGDQGAPWTSVLPD